METTKQTAQKEKGFTLIEILVVIGIIAVLAAVVLVAINPARQFAQARDSQRTSNVNAILNAVGQYVADNKGDYPAAVVGLSTSTPTAIASGTGGSEADLCSELVPTYIPALPTDPNAPGHNGESISSPCPSSYDTNYNITRDADNRIVISAPNTELSTTTISSTR